MSSLVGMLKRGTLIFIAVLYSFLFSAQQSYNSVIYNGLDSLVDSLLTQDEAEHLKEQAELMLIFNEVNKYPCQSTVVYVMVVDEKNKPVKKFNLTFVDYRGNYAYSSSHVNESASIWIDETFNQIGNYKMTIHRKKKINSSDPSSSFRMRNKQCNFVFRKVVVK